EAGFEPLAVRIFRRDAFQVVARPIPTDACPARPACDPWQEVLATLHLHARRYYFGGHFLWRKPPGIKQRFLWGVRQDPVGGALQDWLQRPALAPVEVGAPAIVSTHGETEVEGLESPGSIAY